MLPLLIIMSLVFIVNCECFNFRTTSNMNKVFCSHCGNKTLKKLAVTVSEDGSVQMHFSKNPKVLNPKGLRVRRTHTHTRTHTHRI